MDSKEDLEFWLDFVSENEEKDTTLEQITFYDLKRIFESYFKSLNGELERIVSSLKFPFKVKDIKLEIKKEEKEKYYIKISYYINGKDYTIDSYNIDKLGIYYTGYHLNEEQTQIFYQENYNFFQRVILVYYLSNLFYQDNSTFYKEYRDYETGTKLVFSNHHKPSFSIWRKINGDMYGYDTTIFSKNYLNHPEFNELYDSVLKRIILPITSINDHFKYLIELAKIDKILISTDYKMKNKI